MSRIDQTTRAFDMHCRAQFEMNLVRHSEIEELWGIWDSIRQKWVSSETDPEAVRRVREPIFRIRRLVTGLPLSFSHLDIPLPEISENLRDLLSSRIYKPVHSLVLRTLDISESLRTQKENPIADEIKKHARKNALLVISDSFFLGAVNQWALDEVPHLNLRVINRSEMSQIDYVDQIIYLGSPFFISYRRFGSPDWRFARDPKSYFTHFIMYPFGDSQYSVTGLLTERNVMRQISTSAPFTPADYVEEFDSESEWEDRERRMSGQSGHDSNTKVQARFIGLAGKRSIYFEDSDEATVFAVVKGMGEKLDIQRIPLNSLTQGGLIVVRTEGANADLIQSMADELGAKKPRQDQHTWKGALKDRIQERGYGEVRQTLRNEYGLSSNNLADWVFNPRRIGPQSESDFRALCKFLRIEDQATSLWRGMKKIRSLHIKAGHEALSTLRKGLEQVDVDDPELRRKGALELSIEGLGEIGVYRVEHVGSTTHVDVDLLQVLTDNRES